MLSLDNSSGQTPDASLTSLFERVGQVASSIRVAGPTPPPGASEGVQRPNFLLEPKLDGMSLSLSYLVDPDRQTLRLERVLSRGDGKQGEDLTASALDRVEGVLPEMKLPSSMLMPPNVQFRLLPVLVAFPFHQAAGNPRRSRSSPRPISTVSKGSQRISSGSSKCDHCSKRSSWHPKA